MSSRSIGALSPAMQLLCNRHLDLCRRDYRLRASSIDVILTCTYRSDEEQARLYAQGRDPSVPGPIVTNARPGQSAHNHRNPQGEPSAEAYDVAILEGGKLVWDDHDAWAVVGAYGTQVGLKWFGVPDARFKESPHFQNKEF